MANAARAFISVLSFRMCHVHRRLLLQPSTVIIYLNRRGQQRSNFFVKSSQRFLFVIFIIQICEYKQRRRNNKVVMTGHRYILHVSKTE